MRDAHPEYSAEDLIGPVYDQLRALAARMWSARSDVSIQPTMLVHEAYLKLAASGGPWKDRRHFTATAALAMRQILADRAKARVRLKRGGDRHRVTLTGLSTADEPIDLVDLDAALSELEALDPRRARVVVLRALGGLSVEEAAETLEVSPRTVKSDWRVARAWLVSRLRDG